MTAKRTRRRGRRFPYHGLGTGIQVIEEIKEGGVDKLESKTLAKAMDHKSDKSGTFQNKVNSAKHYGLITELKQREEKKELRYYVITELGKRIVTPIGIAEKEDAIRQAFFTFDLWKEVYEKYKENRKLPECSTLENLLEREYGISPVSKSTAYKSFVNSGKLAAVFKETEEGIIYTDFEEGEEEEEGEREGEEGEIEETERKKEIKLPQISTSVNITISVDTKDETSVKNLITILNAIAKLRITKKE